jgi:GNAT superfamily N-acetyltransferase
MTAITFVSSRIRKVNVRSDLLAVADLIEICFANTLDDDGREYLRNLRWTARDLNYINWLQGAAERISAPLYGFVWEENGLVVGNLSLIPLYRRGKIVYLIANVAVHPDYRRRGIGRQLTQAAIDHLRERGLETAWLQVRDDNPAAYHLYQSLGFVERARRTTWLSASTPSLQVRTLPEGVSVQPRHVQDWRLQSTWLRQVYPPEVAWNLPLSYTRLSPNPWRRLLFWLRGENQQHWAAYRGGKPIGFLSWEPLRSSSDVLWLASTEPYEDQAIQALLPIAREALASRVRPLSINYPAGRGSEAFLRAGFSHHQTLIWMTVSLNQS